ncbi:hypothetical protein NMY22_g16980 [Coprinellus aureogranulatus]|nr:hypothetical protein NMY22_g16980 [Coprinellus aureogranulatus]
MRGWNLTRDSREGEGDMGDDGKREGWEEVEDRRVVNAALMCVCNVVLEFSPLKPTFLQQGIMPRLAHLISSSDPTLRLNALWAVKNLVYRSSSESIRDIMGCLGWVRVYDLLHDHDLAIQEQAYGVLRNVSGDVSGLDMLLREMGQDELLECVSATIAIDAMPSTPTSPSASPVRAASPPSLSRSSSGQPAITHSSSLQDRTPVIVQALFLLWNMCNAPSYSTAILSNPALLANLRSCLAECGTTSVSQWWNV